MKVPFFKKTQLVAILDYDGGRSLFLVETADEHGNPIVTAFPYTSYNLTGGHCKAEALRAAVNTASEASMPLAKDN